MLDVRVGLPREISRPPPTKTVRLIVVDLPVADEWRTNESVWAPRATAELSHVKCQPDLPNRGSPKWRPTPGRASPDAALPRSFPLSAAPSRKTLTVSTPVSNGSFRSIAHPESVETSGNVVPSTGTSTPPTGSSRNAGARTIRVLTSEVIPSVACNVAYRVWAPGATERMSQL